MGKSLIVKGADFTINGLDSTWNEMQLVQGFVNTNSGSSNYGKIYISSGSAYMNAIQAKFLIPAGESISVKITNDDVIMSDLLIGYIASANNVAYVDGNVVSNIALTFHPASSSIRESDGTFTIENTSNTDLYFYCDFTYDTSSGPAIPVSGKKCLYKRLQTE